MNPFQKASIIISLGVFLFLSVFALSVSSASADTPLLALGDIGCKSASITNLKNIDARNLPFLGVGDYLYKCSPSSVQKYWDGISVKIGSKGNHDTESNSKTWAKVNLKYGDRGYGSWKLNNEIALIILDPYQSYKQGSAQYNYVLSKTQQFQNRDDIKWIVYVTHEPLWTPDYGGGHPPNTGLRSAYADLLASNKNVLLLQAHNHGTWWGIMNGIKQIGCGGGGYGGDTLDDSNGFPYATT